MIVHRWCSMIFVSVLIAFFFISCSSQPQPQPDARPDLHKADHPRARALDLVVPESSDDVTKLDDAALASQLAMANKLVNELTSQTFEMALEQEGASSAAYRTKLRQLKIAETRLGDLEQEQIRRKNAK